jgi:hypothetical protein
LDYLNKKDAYDITPADEQVIAGGVGQLVGQFLLDREGIVRWTFTEADEGGRRMFGAPNGAEVMSAATQLPH